MAVIYGNTGNETINGTAGDDTIYGWASGDNANSPSGDDILYGGTGNDSLYGGTGNDYLYGGSGSDYLDGGGTGKDYLYGEGGVPIFLDKTGQPFLAASPPSVAQSVVAAKSVDAAKSVCAVNCPVDKYILGQVNQVYYDNAGNGDYAVIYDFDPQDSIHLEGSSTNYSLKTSPISVGSSAADTGIYFNNSELIGIVADVSDLNLSGSYFNYV